MNVKTGFLTGFSLAAVAIALAMVPAAASYVTPTFVPGNPSCTDLGYNFGFKVEPPNSGTYDIDGTNTVTITGNMVYFEWSSTLGVDAVIVKGGTAANVYVYDPPAESFGDTGLHSPPNPNRKNQPYELSHIEFCYDYELRAALDVLKTAETTFTRTFGWEIDKNVTPEMWDLFTGDSGTSRYTVSVSKDDGTDSEWAVAGTITITNNTPEEATIQSVLDTISGFGAVSVDCGVSFPYTLPPGGSLECSYSSPLPDGATRTNTVTVTTSGNVDGAEAVAEVTFGDPTTVVNDAVTVEDTFAGPLGGFGDDGSAGYERTFTCDGDEGKHDNKATIVETGLSDSESVTVRCYGLTVTKTAATSFAHIWRWTIDKLASDADLVLAQGQLFQVNYEVTLDAMDEFVNVVSGDIWIANPAPIDAELTGVSDVVSLGIVADVDCPSLTVPAGGSLHCTYRAELPDASDRTNTATATLQNYAYDSAGNPTASGTTDFSGSANVTFDPNGLAEEVDECVDVTDTNLGFLGTVCEDAVPQTFEYSLWFGAHADADVPLVCGDNEHTNTASFVTRDTGATGSDDWTVSALVTCEQVSEGCTLTPGYWKTHSEYGPAPFDEAWELILPSRKDTPFFLSGQTYYEVLWTEPSENAYYILAHAYIAAGLNQLNGASIPADVLTAFNDATSLLNTYSPAEIASLQGDDPLRQRFITLAGVLDAYNNGLSGPGHCSE